MYISKLVLNPQNRSVQRDLADSYRLHQTIMKAFVGTSPGRVLFRLETGPEVNCILVQSEIRPQWAMIDDGYFVTEPTTKEVKLALRQGQRLRFRLRANPTVKRGGKREGLLSEDEQIAWLNRKGTVHGFTVMTVYVHDQRFEVGKSGSEGEVRMFCATFDGHLTVSDPEKLLQAVENGIGSGKGFGNGLLSLARAE